MDERIELAARLIGDELGRTPDAVRVAVSTPNHLVCVAQVGRTEVVFKADTNDPIDLEAWAYERARRIGVPTPDVLALDRSRSRFPGEWMIASVVPGVALADATLPTDLAQSAFRATGDLMRRLHEIPLAGFGWIRLDEFRTTGEVVGAHESWWAVIVRQVEIDLSVIAPAGVVDARTAEALARTVHEARDDLGSVTDARFLHGDFGSEHVFVDPDSGDITGLIDFADVIAGDRAFELAGFDHWHSDHDAHARLVLEGYEPDEKLHAALERRRSLYDAVRCASGIRWVHQRGADPRRYVDRLHARLGDAH